MHLYLERENESMGFSRAWCRHVQSLQGWISFLWQDLPDLFKEILCETNKLVKDEHELVRACVPKLLEIFLDSSIPQPHKSDPVAVTCTGILNLLLQDDAPLVRESAIGFSKALCKEWPISAASIIEALPVSECI